VLNFTAKLDCTDSSDAEREAAAAAREEVSAAPREASDALREASSEDKEAEKEEITGPEKAPLMQQMLLKQSRPS